MRIRFLFYKAKIDGKPLDDAISLWTGFLSLISFQWNRLKYNYSHVEIWFEGVGVDGSGFGKWQGSHYEYLGTCFSSTSRGKSSGTRFMLAEELLANPHRWDYIEIEVNPFQFNLMDTMAQSQAGKDYDFAGLFGFFVPWNTQQDDKWFCSEICAWLADAADLISLPNYKISPRRLAKVLVDKCNVETKPLI